MVSREEFLKIAMHNSQYGEARAILTRNGLDFSLYSCTNEVISRVINDVDKAAILAFIDKSNRLEKDITDVQNRVARIRDNATLS